MKNFFVLVCALLLTMTTQAQEVNGIVASIKPLHSLVSSVVGDSSKVSLLLAGNSSPHGLQLKPSQMRQIQNAKVIFYIDNNFELFAKRAFKNAPRVASQVSVVDGAALELLPRRSGGVWEDHEDHGGHESHEDHEDKQKGHSIIDEHSEHSQHGNYDMHVWLAPNNAKKIARLIAQELSTVYPDNKNIYKKNLLALIARIDELDARLKKELASVKNKPFILFHDAYAYFERAYDLHAVGSIVLDPDEALSPSRMHQVRKKIQQAKVVCVFREPQFSERAVLAVTENLAVNIGTLDPLGADIADGPELYFTLLSSLASNLKKCLVS